MKEKAINDELKSQNRNRQGLFSIANDSKIKIEKIDSDSSEKTFIANDGDIDITIVKEEKGIEAENKRKWKKKKQTKNRKMQQKNKKEWKKEIDDLNKHTLNMNKSKNEKLKSSKSPRKIIRWLHCHCNTTSKWRYKRRRD